MALKINLKTPNLPKSVSHVFVDWNTNFIIEKNTLDESLASTNDIKVDLDLEAVKNEIRNLLSTPKYTRLINPLFGFDLKAKIGSPISQMNAEMMRMDIVNALKNSSGRFTLTGLDIFADIDQQAYYVVMNISCPYFPKEYTVTGFLPKSGTMLLI